MTRLSSPSVRQTHPIAPAHPILVVFAGLPGSGKTTVARALARRMAGVHLRIDSIEQAMARSSLRIQPAEDAGYVVAYALAEDNLRNGLSVIADSVNPIALTRRAWKDIAANAGSAHLDVELVCSDVSEHRRRVESRLTDVEGLRLPSWEDVLNRDYTPWTGDRLTIDTSVLGVEDAVDAIGARVSAATASGPPILR